MALSFHEVCEVIASKILGFCHISGKTNPADSLSKHWGHAQIWTMLKPLLFHKGDTFNLWEGNKDVSTNQANGEWQVQDHAPLIVCACSLVKQKGILKDTCQDSCTRQTSFTHCSSGLATAMHFPHVSCAAAKLSFLVLLLSSALNLCDFWFFKTFFCCFAFAFFIVSHGVFLTLEPQSAASPPETAD